MCAWTTKLNMNMTFNVCLQSVNKHEEGEDERLQAVVTHDMTNVVPGQDHTVKTAKHVVTCDGYLFLQNQRSWKKKDA